MKDRNLADLTKSVVDLLAPLDSEKRRRVVGAAWTLLGEASESPDRSERQQNSDGSKEQATSGANSPKSFFDTKKPSSKIEELATAARFREQHQDADTHSKADLEKIVKDARRNFDSRNFAFDLRNAKNKGLFNRNTGKDKITLSYKGQEFVDALPNRQTLGAKKRGRPKRKEKR
jgi:hypothetical protein